MKSTSCAVYKNYLKNSLHHPLLFITAIIFSVFTSAFFFIKQQFFTSLGSTDLLAFFTSVPYICILVIPALCFKHSDSIYDDFIPLQQIQKLIIKFLAILTQYAILLILLLLVPIIVSLFGNVDWGQVFASLICLLFYGACEIALCLFFVEVFENNISSFVVNAILLSIFNSAHLFAVYVPMNSFFINMFKQLSFAWHFDAAGKGILDTRDLFWFACGTVIFIFLALLYKLKTQGKKFTANEKFTNVCSGLILILVLLNSGKWYLRLDCSNNKTYTISDYSKKLIKNADSNIKITYYRSGTLSNFYPQIRDVSDFLQSYCSIDSNISLLIVDPDKDEQAMALLQNYDVTSQPMRSVKNSNSVEYVNVYSAIIIEYNGNVEIIPYILSSQTLEYDLGGRIKHLITGQVRLINIIVGNDLSLYDSTGYNLVIPWLNSQGFICNPIDITNPDFESELDNTTGPLLIIGDNHIMINQAVAIENYLLSKNENALFTVSPYSINFQNWSLSQNRNTNIIEILENWGVFFTNRIAADLNCSVITMESQDQTETMYEQGSIYREDINYSLFVNLLPQNNTNLGVTEFWATPLDLSENTQVQPYLISSPYSWYYDIDREKSENLLETNPFYVRDQDNSDKEKLSQVLGAEIQGSLNGLFTDSVSQNNRFIIIPDQYFLSTILNYGYIGGEYGDYRNFEFLTNCLLKLNSEEELAALQNKALKDTSLSKLSSQKDFDNARKLSYAICFVIVPFFIILISLAAFIIQQRKIRNVTK